MADNENFDLDKDSQLFPQNNTEGSADGSKTEEKDPAPKDIGKPEDGDAPKGEAPKGDASDKEADPKPAEAPVEFDPTALKVPEGVVPDAELLNSFGELVGKMNLSQEQAQELVDLQVKAVQAQEAQHTEVRRQWVEELKADPEFGKTRFDGTVSDAQAVLRRFDDSGEVLQALQASGFGDNPAVIKMLARIKRSISDDEFHVSGGSATREKGLAELMYGDK